MTEWLKKEFTDPRWIVNIFLNVVVAGVFVGFGLIDISRLPVNFFFCLALCRALDHISDHWKSSK